MDDFVTVNGIYAKFFGNHAPARSAVEVARLPKDVLVEVEAIARYVYVTTRLLCSAMDVFQLGIELHVLKSLKKVQLFLAALHGFYHLFQTRLVQNFEPFVGGNLRTVRQGAIME